MKFSLSTVEHYYNKEDMEKLSKLGFKFKFLDESCIWNPNDLGEFEILDSEPSIEINSLEDLLNFSREYGSVILNTNTIDDVPKIEIYDGYID
jgi:hypothetical protein